MRTESIRHESIRTVLADARDRTQSREAHATAIQELVARRSLDQTASGGSDDMASRIRDATNDTAIESALADLKQTMLTDGGPKPD